MNDHQAAQIMVQIAQICVRMKHAREWAGLTIYQAERMFGIRNLRDVEAAKVLISLPFLLRACIVYGVDQVWMLTGVNPNFDPQPWLEQFAETGIPAEERDRALEQLAAIGRAP